MLSAINGYPLSDTSSENSKTAGPDFRKRSFDDLLLLPSAPSNAASRNYLCYSAKVSPVLPPISKSAEVHRKYNTAPASPNHHSYYSTTVTPQTPPLFNRTQLAPDGLAPARTNQQQETLPSLRHLQLLPDPRIQEYACYYPDTSEHTPIWKRTLVHWCRETNYQDYTKIVHEVSHDRTQLSALLRGSTNTTSLKSVPSVLKPKDAFQGLSDYARSVSAPMTPPMSPIGENDRNQPPEFTAFVSSKLIQTVKQENHRSHRTPGRHKKTDSFKAMQLKKLFSSRDILSNDSRTCQGRLRVSKPPAANEDNHRLTKVNIGNAARTLAISLDTQGRRSSSPTRSSGSDSSTTSKYVTKPAHAQTRSRSRSPSPERPSTPPAPASASKYHKFAFDSPQSPISTLKQGSYSSSTKTTPKRRRSSGSSSHGAVRKCVSCHSNDSPCWRPSWSGKKQDQLCNSCGLRYKKTHTRCLNEGCRKIPTKGELSIMKANGIHRQQKDDGTIIEGYRCLFCNSIAECVDTIAQNN